MRASRGRRRQRRQNNKTNYTRQKVHVNMWNKRTFVPSCSRVRRQLLHFHVVCKTWSIFQQLSSIFSFRKTRWRQWNFSENRNQQCNQSKYMLRRTQGLCRNMFIAWRRRRPRLSTQFLHPRIALWSWVNVSLRMTTMQCAGTNLKKLAPQHELLLLPCSLASLRQ